MDNKTDVITPRQRDDARRLALEFFRAIHDGDSLDDCINRLSSQPKFVPTGLVRHLLMGALRQQGQLERVLKRHLTKPLHKTPNDIRDILLLSAYEVIFTTAPKASVAHAWVEIAKNSAKLKRISNLLNAILRKLVEESEASLPSKIYNLPFWLRKRLIADWGQKRMEQVAEVISVPPPIDLYIRQGTNIDVPDGIWFGNKHWRCEDAGLDIRQIEGFDDGKFWVQNIAASLPLELVELLGHDVKSALDLCAAPGGKTMQMVDMGWDVTAVDVSSRRLQRLSENLVRCHMDESVELVRSDVRRYPAEKTFDVVLLDAPCTATGTIRRHPDLLWQKGEETLDELTLLQAEMLKHARHFVKKDGLLVYAVCSLLKDEGERQIEQFLSQFPQFFMESIVLPEWLNTHVEILNTGSLRILPDHLMEKGGMDGFYMAILRHG